MSFLLRAVVVDKMTNFPHVDLTISNRLIDI